MKALKIIPILLLGMTRHAIPTDIEEVDVGSNLEIIIVYNAESGFFNALTDYVHKIVSPDTYSCNLCALTYGNMGMKKKWADYLSDLPVPITFLHDDQINMESAMMMSAALPAIFIKKNDQVDLLVSAKEINELKTLDQLISTIDKKLGKSG